jgi:phosphatidylglycerophosphate synthase
MKEKKGITASINRTIGVLFVCQILFYFFVLYNFRIATSYAEILAFILSTTVIHAGLWIFLSVMHDHIHLVPTGEKLNHINIANKLTLFRISSIPNAVLLLILVQKYPVLPVLAPLIVAIFLTDLFDGAIARGSRQVTKIGKYLDSISDYAILIAISIAMAAYSMISDWFFILILFRLLFQWAGMGALLIYQGHVFHGATFPGKASIFATMTLYGVRVLALSRRFPKSLLPMLVYLEYAAAGVIAFSLIEKVFTLKRVFVEAKELKRKKAAHVGEGLPPAHDPISGRNIFAKQAEGPEAPGDGNTNTGHGTRP